jgi:hypothetical protein
MPTPADQMFVQLRTIHADELRKRAPNGGVIPKAARHILCRRIPQAAATMPSACQAVKR